MKILKTLLLPFFLLAISDSAQSAQPKECIEEINPDLVKLLEIKFPKRRIPRLAELDQQSINFDQQEGGKGCFAVATGDFDGNRQQDLAILLTPINESDKAPSLIVALKKDKAWVIHQLPTFCETVQFCYVKPQKPGTYLRSAALTGSPNHKSDRNKLTSNTTSVLSGTLESTGIVYVYSKKRWNYVWVSD